MAGAQRGKIKLSPAFLERLRSLEAEPQVAIRRWRNSLLKPGARPGFQPKYTKRKTVPFGRSFQKLRITLLLLTHGVRKRIVAYGLRDALFFFILVDFRMCENQKGISPVATGDSGLCPENPQPLKRLAKLSLRPRAGFSSSGYEWEPGYGRRDE